MAIVIFSPDLHQGSLIFRPYLALFLLESYSELLPGTLYTFTEAQDLDQQKVQVTSFRQGYMSRVTLSALLSERKWPTDHPT